MRGTFANLLGAFRTVLKTLFSGKFKPVWFEQPPAIFTKYVADAQAAVDNLEKLCIEQGADRTGVTKQKTQDAAEAEGLGFEMSRALLEWFRAHGDQTNAAKVDISKSKWHDMRDERFLDQLKLTLSLAKDALTKDAQADEYGITPARVDLFAKEVAEYAEIIAAPQSSIAERKGMTGQMKDKFKEVEAKFVSLDNLILQFGRTPEGRDLISAYQAARIVHDLGGSPSMAKAKAAAPPQRQPPVVPPAA